METETKVEHNASATDKSLIEQVVVYNGENQIGKINLPEEEFINLINQYVSKCDLYKIDKAFDINLKDKDRYTITHYAVKADYINALKLLVESKAKIHAETDNGRTALHFAALNGRKEIVELLIYKGCNIDAQTDDNKYTKNERSWVEKTDQKRTNENVDLENQYKRRKEDLENQR